MFSGLLNSKECQRTVLHICLKAQCFVCSCQERGVSVLTKALEQCLAVSWGVEYEVLTDSKQPPISTEVSQKVIEILKTLFNITHMFHRQEPDEVISWGIPPI